MRLKHFLSVFLTLLTLSVGQMWGADPTVTLDFDGSDASWPYDNDWSCDASSSTTNHTDGGTYSAGMSKNGSQYITYKNELTNIKKVTLWVNRTSSNTAQPTIVIQKSTWNGSAWSDWADVTGTSQTFSITRNTWTQKTFDFSSYKFTGKVRIKYTNSTTAIKMIDDIVITYEEASCDKKVTITKGTPETGGSFNLDKTGQQATCSGLTVTVSNITAPSGKKFSAITQEGIASGVEISQSAKTVTYAANTTGSSTINVTFEDKGCTDHNGKNVTSGSSTSYVYGPIDPYYKFSTRQILYTKTDLGLAAGKKGTIKSIYFEYANETTMTKKTDVKIYMANTSLEALSTSAYETSFTQVYSGPLNCSNGWNEITLDEPFAYNGVGNLVVIIDDNSNAYEGSSFVYKYHEASTTTGAQIYRFSDSENIDPETSSTWASGYTATNNRPNTKFCIQEADMTQYTVNWYVNNSETPAHTQTGYAGVALTDIPAPTKSNCDGNKEFVGWYTDEYEHATNAPAFVSPATIPDGGANYYAVFANTSVGDPVETTLWSEDFNVASGTAPIAPTGITYTCTNGGSDTKIYDDSNCPKGGTCKNLLIGKSTGSFLVEGIPTQGAQSLTLSFSKGGSGTLTVSSPTSNVSVSGNSSGSTITIGQNNVSTFDLLFSNSSSSNLRIVDIAVSAEVAPVTYSNYATTCCTSLASINGSFF